MLAMYDYSKLKHMMICLIFHTIGFFTPMLYALYGFGVIVYNKIDGKLYTIFTLTDIFGLVVLLFDFFGSLHFNASIILLSHGI